MSSRGSPLFYNRSNPFPRPRPPVCAGLSSTVLSLCFGAGWVWPRLTLSLGYPSCYPSPVLIASSNASSPHSSSLWALSVVRRCVRGRATLVLARNCGSALVALGSPKSHPCGCFCSSGSHNPIHLQIPVELVPLVVPFPAFKEKMVYCLPWRTTSLTGCIFPSMNPM